MNGSILVVDDMPDMLKYLGALIGNELQAEVHTADDGAKALRALREHPVGTVLADILMPGMSGMTLLRRIKEIDPSIPVIMMTAYGSIEDAVETLKLGAYDYITKPFDEERLLHALRKSLEYNSLIHKSRELEKIVRERETVESYLGRSPRVRALLETIKVVAKTDLTVLITGDTGTGKDIVARALYAASPRAGKPFLPVNCAAIPENILESELFGYRKGAFTGAMQDKKGLFEAADGGTIFLDEIGDLPLSLQAKLLRILEQKELKPLGEARTYRIDVRVIASTNRNLKEKIALSQFREDLYHRLNVVSIATPALNQIAEDIPAIANHYLSLYSSELGTAPKRFSEEAVRWLASRKWTGNVRELQNEVRKAVIFSRGTTILPEDFPCRIDLPSAEPCGIPDLRELDYKDARKALLERFHVDYISMLLKECQGNVSRAARRANLERQSLQYLMRKYRINSGTFRSAAKPM